MAQTDHWALVDAYLNSGVQKAFRDRLAEIIAQQPSHFALLGIDPARAGDRTAVTIWQGDKGTEVLHGIPAEMIQAPVVTWSEPERIRFKPGEFIIGTDPEPEPQESEADRIWRITQDMARGG